MSASRVGRLADILQVVVSISVLTIALNTYRVRNVASADDPSPKLTSGVQMSGLPEIDYARRPLTLILFERSSCQYCTQSMPFYESLSHTLDRSRIQFVAASLEAKEVSVQYLHGHNVIPDFVVQLPATRSYPIRGTPTLVLIDNSGKVRDSWVGALDPEREHDVKNALVSN